MKTFTERRDAMLQIVCEPDSGLDAKEQLKYVYHWYMYEINLRRRAKANKRLKKHASQLNYALAIHRLHEEMK